MANYTKRQLTESSKRADLIHNLLVEKANITESGISWEDGQMYFRDNNSYKEYILATFWDYKSLKAAQDHLLTLLRVIDEVIESKHDLLYKIHN